MRGKKENPFLEILRDIKPVSIPQMQFLASPDRECGYGGSAFCGKSIMLALDAMAQVDHPRYKAIIFRRKRKELKTLVEYCDGIYIAHGATAKGTWESGRTYTWKSGATIELNSMEHEADWEDYHGNNYTYLGFDELVTFTQAQYINLVTWFRSVDEGLTPYVRWTSNPWPAEDGDGIEWIMDRFRIPPFEEITQPIRIIRKEYDDEFDQEFEACRMFIPATYKDNRAVPPRAIAEWKAGLKRDLDPDKYQAYLKGIWGVAPGRFFKRFSVGVHVISPEECAEKLESYYVDQAACGMDHGSDAATCLLKGQRLEDDTVIVTDEYFKEDKPIVYHAPRIRDFARVSPSSDRQLDIKADPTMWKVGEKKVTYSDKFISTEYEDRGVSLLPAINNKEQGYRAIKDALFFEEDLEGLEEPLCFISSKCKHLIKDLMNAPADPGDPDNKIMYDNRYHAIAAFRYLMMHLSRPRRTPEDEKKPNVVQRIRQNRIRERNRRRGVYA